MEEKNEKEILKDLTKITEYLEFDYNNYRLMTLAHKIKMENFHPRYITAK
jgi:hypothetical protein